MEHRKLVIRGISCNLAQSEVYALLLEDVETSIKLPVVIGSFEAQAISIGLEKYLKTPRPLTHDLFADFIACSGYALESVLIHQIIDGVFFSNINFKNKTTGEDLIVDARTSDAVAMSVRFDVPIYATDQVLQEAGILLDLVMDTDVFRAEYEKIYSGNPLTELTMEELSLKLEEAVRREDYDEAFEIQVEISRRSSKIE